MVSCQQATSFLQDPRVRFEEDKLRILINLFILWYTTHHLQGATQLSLQD